MGRKNLHNPHNILHFLPVPVPFGPGSAGWGRRTVRFLPGLRRTPRPRDPEGPGGGGFVRGSPVRGTGAAQGVPS